MSKLKLSKSSLQQQRDQLKLFKKLLPSLDLKRRQLTVEAKKAREELEQAKTTVQELEAKIGQELPMLEFFQTELQGLVKMTDYSMIIQNVVGVKLPSLQKIECVVKDYSRFLMPPWVDVLVQRLKDAAEQRVRAKIATERVEIIDKAVRRVTQRVNLFDKILIPGAQKNIKRIQIFLGDTERTAVINSKLAKGKQTVKGYSLKEEAYE